MKKNIWKVGALGVMCLTCFSCTQEPVSCPTPRKASPVDSSAYYQISVEDSVKAYPNLFGANVLILQNEEEADALLDKLSDMTGSDLQNAYQGLGIYSPSIENIIQWDLLLEQTARRSGLTLTQLDESTDTTLVKAIYEKFADELATSDLPYRHYWKRETCRESPDYGQESYYIEPAGQINLQALCNAKGIVIVDKVVHKYFADGLLTAPVDKFIYLANDTSLQDIEQKVAKQAIAGIKEDDFVIHYNNSVILPTSLPTHFSGISATGYSKIIVDISTKHIWGWFFTTDRKASVRIQNFQKNGKGALVQKRTGTTANIDFTSKFNVYDTYPNCCKYTLRIYQQKVRDRTFSQRVQVNAHFYPNLPVVITDIDLSACNSCNASVTYKQSL